MRKGDLIIVGLIVVLGLGGLLLSNLDGIFPRSTTNSESTGYEFYVTIDGSEVYRAPLINSDEEEFVEISLSKMRPDDPDAHATLKVHEGQVRVMPMSRELCPDAICHEVMGWISRPGQAIVCMPNLMIVRVEAVDAGEDLGYDIIAS